MRAANLVLALSLGACGAPAGVASSPSSSAGAPAAAQVGQPAPAFSLSGVDGATHTLADQRGKTVVLEWYNPDCPFVKAAHGEGGKLRSAGNAHTANGIVWWAINSGAPGNQGHGLERNRASLAEYGITYPVLLDEDGAVGKLYAAKTTPHVFVIDPAGTLVYDGALDNAPLGDSKGQAYVPYLERTLAELGKGEAITQSRTKPYGCSVKY